MFSGKVRPMIRLNRKIIHIVLACLLGLNLATSGAIAAASCPSQMCCSGPMDMNHCDGLLNFAFPMHECCGECHDIFCDLMKNPLQDVNAVNSSPFQGSYAPFLLGIIDSLGVANSRIISFEPKYQFPTTLAWGQIPLYIEHLTLII